jgi:hypothetical protein
MSDLDRLAQTTKTARKDLERQLKLYAAAAAAAGVSLLAQCSDARAEIVYARAHYEIPIGFKLIDINGDGIPDFAFTHSTGGLSNSRLTSLHVDALRSNGVVAAAGSAAVLAKGAVIGASGNFAARNFMAASHIEFGSAPYSHKTFGPWSNVYNRYLGIVFDVGGATHYGWIRLDVNDKKYPLSAVVTGYAYETTPNKSLRAGQISEDESNEPRSRLTNPAEFGASLGMLAAGANFLPAWRREEDAAQAA